MLTLRATEVFTSWLTGLRDTVARTRIAARLRRLAIGNPGDVRPIGDGLSELRIDHGPGYRVYYVQRGDVLIVLLCGGDKGTQRRDIQTAKNMANDLEPDQDAP